MLLSMVVQQRVVILECSQEKMSTHPSTPPSCNFLPPNLKAGKIVTSLYNYDYAKELCSQLICPQVFGRLELYSFLILISLRAKLVPSVLV